MDSKDFFEQMRQEELYYKQHYFQGFIRNTYHFLFWGLPRRFKDGCRALKHAWQRVFRKYDNTAVWDLHIYLASIALSVLISYRKDGQGIPGCIEGFENKPFVDQQKEWDRILGCMITSFQMILDDDMDFEVHEAEWYVEQNKKIQEGMKYFCFYYRSLWS